ncbi:MAG: hypothetical protein JSR19_13250 [Proteobacteria bacterium]|nr:hypothetical protein [Pseudomonadota bacterium]HQR03474.1 hypothetical protein [Rhodocyclaceae bacterium]
MSMEFGPYLRKEQIGNFVINLILNGGFAWWLTHGSQLPLWKGDGAMGPDILMTSLLLAYLLALIVAWLTRKKRDEGKTPRLDAGRYPLISRLPATTGKLSASVAVVGVVIGVAMVATMHVLGLDPYPRVSYVVLKAVYAAVLAIICNYIVIVRILSQPQGA